MCFYLKYVIFYELTILKKGFLIIIKNELIICLNNKTKPKLNFKYFEHGWPWFLLM